jgi:putative SOS response-associated peptidase YedK
MKPIHERMPVILPADAYALWLDKADASGAQAVRPQGDGSVSGQHVR